jgi:hypothetical protein
MKDSLRKLVREFMDDLFSMAEMDNDELAEELGRNSAYFSSISNNTKVNAS